MPDFKLSGQLELSGVSLGPGVKNQLQSFNLGNLNIKGIEDLNTASVLAAKNVRELSGQYNKLNADLNGITKQQKDLGKATTRTARSAQTFADQMGLALRRFTAFTLAAGGVFTALRQVRDGIADAIAFERELVKVTQVTKALPSEIANLRNEISRLSTTYGTNATELAQVSKTLSQTGLTARETQKVLEGIAKSDLAPTFANITGTTEGLVAIMRQFNISAGQTETSLSQINAVAGSFAVEADDIVRAVQKVGGVFKATSRDVGDGNRTLAELLALFTSVRATTRESADTIGTGLRTIFARILRPQNLQFFDDLGIKLTDAEGQFIGTFDAVQKLGTALQSIDSLDPRFSAIVERLGGIRQFSKTLPLLQQTALQQEALNRALAGQDTLTQDAALAQQTLAVEVAKTRQEFAELFREIANSDSFVTIAKGALQAAQAFANAATALADILPILALAGTLRVGRNIIGSAAARGFGGRLLGFNTGGRVPGRGQNKDTVPAMLTKGEFVMSRDAVDKIGVNNLRQLNNNPQGILFANTGTFIGGGTQSGSLNIPISERAEADAFRQSIERKVAKLEERLARERARLRTASSKQSNAQQRRPPTVRPTNLGTGSSSLAPFDSPEFREGGEVFAKEAKRLGISAKSVNKILRNVAASSANAGEALDKLDKILTSRSKNLRQAGLAGGGTSSGSLAIPAAVTARASAKDRELERSFLANEERILQRNQKRAAAEQQRESQRRTRTNVERGRATQSLVNAIVSDQNRDTSPPSNLRGDIRSRGPQPIDDKVRSTRGDIRSRNADGSVTVDSSGDRRTVSSLEGFEEEERRKRLARRSGRRGSFRQRFFRSINRTRTNLRQVPRAFRQFPGAFGRAARSAPKSALGNIRRAGVLPSAIGAQIVGNQVGGTTGNVISGAGGGALLGSAFGPQGAIAGAIIGGIEGVFSAAEQKAAEEVEKSLKSIQEFSAEIERISLNGFTSSEEGDVTRAIQQALTQVDNIRDLQVERRGGGATGFFARNLARLPDFSSPSTFFSSTGRQASEGFAVRARLSQEIGTFERIGLDIQDRFSRLFTGRGSEALNRREGRAEATINRREANERAQAAAPIAQAAREQITRFLRNDQEDKITDRLRIAAAQDDRAVQLGGSDSLAKSITDQSIEEQKKSIDELRKFANATAALRADFEKFNQALELSQNLLGVLDQELGVRSNNRSRILNAANGNFQDSFSSVNPFDNFGALQENQGISEAKRLGIRGPALNALRDSFQVRGLDTNFRSLLGSNNIADNGGAEVTRNFQAQFADGGRFAGLSPRLRQLGRASQISDEEVTAFRNTGELPKALQELQAATEQTPEAIAKLRDALNAITQDFIQANNELSGLRQQRTNLQGTLQSTRIEQQFTRNRLFLGREPTVDEGRRADLANAQRLAGTVDPAAIGARILELQAERRDIQGRDDIDEVQRQDLLGNNAQDLANNTNALKDLASKTAGLSAIQNRLTQIQQKRESARSTAEEIVFGSPEQRRQARRQQAALAVAQQGGLEALAGRGLTLEDFRGGLDRRRQSLANDPEALRNFNRDIANNLVLPNTDADTERTLRAAGLGGRTREEVGLAVDLDEEQNRQAGALAAQNAVLGQQIELFERTIKNDFAASMERFSESVGAFNQEIQLKAVHTVNVNIQGLELFEGLEGTVGDIAKRIVSGALTQLAEGDVLPNIPGL